MIVKKLSSIAAVLFVSANTVLPVIADETSADADGANKTTIFDRPKKKNLPGTELTADALSLANALKIDGTLEELKAVVRNSGPEASQSELVKIMFLRQTIARKLQFVSLELEEALANIDGDLSYTNMQYSLFSSKHDRSVMLNNVATFLTSGSMGVLDSATSITQSPPLPNVFGITGNSAAIAIPLWGLRPRKYKPLRNETTGNMLAPIFDLQYSGEGYDPIIWQYLESIPADSKDNLTRRQLLLSTWKKFRKFDKEKAASKENIAKVAEVSKDNETVTLDLLK